MAGKQEVNALDLRPMYAGQVVEFPTMVGAGMYLLGLGEWGSPTVLHGDLVTVANGYTNGLAWTKATIMAEVISDGVARRVRIQKTLGPRCTVTLTGEPGFACNAHLVLVDTPLETGGLIFAPGVYRAVPRDDEPDRYAIRFHRRTYPLPPAPEA